MSDVVSLELLLDPATERAVRAEWRALADAHMSSLAPHTSPSNRPHVTLLVRTALAPLAVPLLERLRGMLPLAVTLGEPILFGGDAGEGGEGGEIGREGGAAGKDGGRSGGEGGEIGREGGEDGGRSGGGRSGRSADRRVFVRPVLLSPELEDMHRMLHAGVDASDDDAPHTRPGEWTPHVTLARRLRVADIPAARALVNGELRGSVAALRRWDAASRTVTPLIG